MMSLLVLRERLRTFYSKYDLYILAVLKFAVTLTALLLINQNLGYVPLPTDADGKQVYGAQSDRGYGICKGAKNPDGAAYFLRYFLNGDHYDEDELYKNAECAKLYHELQKNKDTSKFGCSYAVFSIFSNDSDPMYGVFPDLKDCTAAQIPTVLATKANTFNSCIERANTILKDAIAQNQK